MTLYFKRSALEDVDSIFNKYNLINEIENIHNILNISFWKTIYIVVIIKYQLMSF